MEPIKDAKDLLEIAKELSAYIRGEKEDALRLDCMEGMGVYTTTVNVQSAFSKWAAKLGSRSCEFLASEVYDVKMYALRPPLGRIGDAVTREGEKILVDFTKVLGFDMFRMEVYYRIGEGWLRGLVHHRSSPEPLVDAMKYHLSAQLTDPWSLSRGFKEIDVDDFPITARVHLQEQITTALPTLQMFRRFREIEAQLLSDYDPRHATKIIALQRERYRLRRRLMVQDPRAVLRNLVLILRPNKFMSYLRADQDFRLHQCQWGTDLFEALGAVALPKNMEITSRTDLTLRKPASKGFLLYESGKFFQDVESIVNKADGRPTKARPRRDDASDLRPEG